MGVMVQLVSPWCVPPRVCLPDVRRDTQGPRGKLSGEQRPRAAHSPAREGTGAFSTGIHAEAPRESGVWKVGCLQNLPSPVSKPDAQRTLKADLSVFWRNALGVVVGKIYDLLYIVIRS